jgi:uncharacterized protein (TIGR02147 family)
MLSPMRPEIKSSAELLKEEFARKLRMNPKYSLRAFSKLLGVSPGELSELLNGKRPLTVKRAHQIAGRLGWSDAELSRLLQLCVQDHASRQGLPAADAPAAYSLRRLPDDVFRVIADWYCFAILSLAEIPEFRAEARWISKRLKISIHESTDALARLERVGLLIRQKNQLRPSPEFVITGSEIPSEAIRAYHRALLQKGMDALETQPPTERDITGICLAIDPRDLGEIRREVEAFQDRIVRRYSKAGRKKEVYQLECALFRLSETLSKERT